MCQIRSDAPAQWLVALCVLCVCVCVSLLRLLARSPFDRWHFFSSLAVGFRWCRSSKGLTPRAFIAAIAVRPPVQAKTLGSEIAWTCQTELVEPDGANQESLVHLRANPAPEHVAAFGSASCKLWQAHRIDCKVHPQHDLQIFSNKGNIE